MRCMPWKHGSEPASRKNHHLCLEANQERNYDGGEDALTFEPGVASRTQGQTQCFRSEQRKGGSLCRLRGGHFRSSSEMESSAIARPMPPVCSSIEARSSRSGRVIAGNCE